MSGPMDEALADWFVRDILPHEAALTRFLRRAWPIAADIHDLRQEIYVRVIEAAIKTRPFAPKSFLFTTARHLLADRARRNRIVSIDLMGDLDALNVLIDEISPERRTSARQQLAELSAAFNQLSDKSREVVWMRKVEDVSQKEIAKRLATSEASVEKHVSRGMRAIADYLFGSDKSSAAGVAANRKDEESGHEQ
jgi:RNA polymerase sigma factor (sigma-70 family)